MTLIANAKGGVIIDDTEVQRTAEMD